MSEEKIEFCPLCARQIVHRSNHHLIPKTRGGKSTVVICCDCHDAIHSLLSNKELERQYSSVESLLANDEIIKVTSFLSKQDPNKRHKTKLAGNQKRRNRNG